MSRINDTDTQLIEKHLDKQLNEQEQILFNQCLSDPTFANEVRLYEKAVQSVYAFGDSRLKAILKAEEAKLQADNAAVKTPQYPSPVVRPIWQRWAMAASFLLIASAAAWLLLPNIGKTGEKTGNTEGVFASKFKPYPNYANPTVRGEETKDVADKAYALYEHGDYKKALTYFEKIQPPLNEDLFLQANAYLVTQQAEKAIPLLEKVSLSKEADAELQQRAEWYLALALSEKQPEQAKVIFQKIEDTPNHNYQAQAAEILEK
jgi:tetratricopeptide (TPR) repeat protein